MARPRGVNVQPCGTSAAYQRHIYYGEEPCPEDREARRLAARNARRQKGIKPRKKPRHGTRTLYQRGCRCEPCKTAQNEYNAALRAGHRRRNEKQTKLWELMIDIMETWGRPMSSIEIAGHVERIRGRPTESVDRLLYRLRKQGLVESVERMGVRKWTVC